MKPFTCHFTVKKQPGCGKEAPIAPSTWSLFEVLAVNALELWQMLLPCSVSIQTMCWQWQVRVVMNPCPRSLGNSLSAEVMPAFLLSYALVSSCFFPSLLIPCLSASSVSLEDIVLLLVLQ